MIRIIAQLIINALIIAFGRGQQTGDSSVIITSDSEVSMLSAGDNVTIHCRVDYLLTGGDTLLWYRSQGRVRELIGKQMNRAREFSNNRYQVDIIETSTQHAKYQLKINSLKVEDSSTIECHSLSSRKATWPLIVCSDTASESCACMVKQGWPSPDCFTHYMTTKSRYKRYRTAVIILSIALFILFIISLILTIRLVRVCLSYARYRRERAEARQPLTPNINIPPLDHVRAPPSALKIHRPPHNGQGVRFVDRSAGSLSGSGSLGFPEGFSGGGNISGAGQQIYGSPGVLISPVQLNASFGYQEQKEGYQTPNKVPYGSHRNINNLDAASVYSNAGNPDVHNMSRISYNQPGNPVVYYQLGNPYPAAVAAQYRPAEVGNTVVVYPANYSQVFSGYADQMVANNLNNHVVMLGGDITAHAVPLNHINELSSSNAAFHTGSNAHMDMGSTTV